MQKLVMGIISLGFLLVLSGCQTNSMSSLNPMGPVFKSYPTGATLTQSVQDALYRSGDPVLAQVHVETNINTVILSGYVKKIRQSDMAEQIAHQVPGVQTVINNLIVHQ